MEKLLATNEKKVTKLLDNVQNSKNMVRTINYSEIQEAIKAVYKHFQFIPKKHLNCRVKWSRYASVFPGAYKYTPMGTRVCFEFVNGKVYITMISREDCNQKYEYYTYAMGDEMKEDIINNNTTF